jgi:S-formylglutathione hydrolase FrmB
MLAAAALVWSILGAAGDARADEAESRACQVPYNPPITDNRRVVNDQVDGHGVTVLLPPAYAASARRYPVLYLWPSGGANENDYVDNTVLIPFTDRLSDEQQAIVVSPFSQCGLYSDSRTENKAWETFHVTGVIPYIDMHYRTIADGAHRASAGFSAGGLGALGYPARHPDLFAAAASFSGLVDVTTPRGRLVVEGALPAVSGEAAPLGLFEADEVWWRDHNPVDLAANLRGLSLYIASGDGTLCPDDVVPDDPAQTTQNVALVPLENAVHEMAQNLDAALSGAGIAHTTDLYGCGTHGYRYVSRDLARWWPIMLHAFGTRASASFDYRTADSPDKAIGLSATSVWGWTFTPDQARAPEFLEVTRASAGGVVLTGSGSTAVTTAPLFRPRRWVRVADEDGVRWVRAGRDGRITFTVTLGPPHLLQQYTPTERLQDGPDYFVTRHIGFVCHGRAGDHEDRLEV